MTDSRDFIGTYPCYLCHRKVRIYGWLPECPLCTKCQADVDRQESKANDAECDVDEQEKDIERSVRAVMTLDRAKEVKQLFADGFTLKALAETCAYRFRGEWPPDQIAGMKLCEVAQELLDNE